MSAFRTQGFMHFAPSWQQRGRFGSAQNGAEEGAPDTGERGSPPSSYAVLAVLEGQNGSVLRLLGLTLLRGVFVIPGIWLASRLARVDMEPWQLLVMGLAGSATISAGMLAYYFVRQRLES